MTRFFIYLFSFMLLLGANCLFADDRPALLGLMINDVAQGAVNVVIRNRDLLARVNDIEMLGLTQVGGRIITIRENRYVSLESLAPAVRFRLDEKNLLLLLTVKLPPENQNANGYPGSEYKKSETRDVTVPPRSTAAPAEANAKSETMRPRPVTKDASPEQSALLDLHVNGIKKSEALVTLRGGDVFVRPADLELAGLKAIVAMIRERSGDSLVSLNGLAPTVRFNVDEDALALRLTVEPAALGSNTINLYRFRPDKIEYREDTSAFFNYAFNLTNFNRFDGFGEAGVSFKNSLLYSGLSRNADGMFVRGLSNLSINYRENLNRLTFGDRLLGSDPLGGNLVMAGIGFSREFGLDPYFTRNPGLHYSGAAATPSTMDVYVNGIFLRRIQLPPGQFELRDLPVPTGSADTRLVLRDAFGREQEITSPFYFTNSLLKQGLHEFSYNLGAERQEFATESWHYSTPVVLGRHRVGVTDTLTAGMRFEASTKVLNGGPSITFLLPLGEMEIGAAASRDQGTVGGGTFLGYSYGGRLFNFGTSVRLLSPGYATTSLKSSDERSWLQLNSVLGFSVAGRAGVSLQYTLENSQKRGALQRYALSTTTRLFNRANLFIRGAYSREPTKDSFGVTVGLTFLYGEVSGTLSYANLDGINGGVASIQKPLPVGTGFGYLFQANTSQGQVGGDSLVQYQGPYGRYEAFYGRSNGSNLTSLSASGGIVYLGGSLLATRPVQESFALIQVPGLVGIRGYTNNLEVGSSDSNGNILVPNLLPYYGNKLSISDKDVPLNYNIATIEKVVAPPYRGGAVVTFPVRKVQRMTGTIAVESSGQTIVPSYGDFALSADGRIFESPIGRDGEFYLENVPPGRYRAEVKHKDQLCELDVEVPDSDESEINIGDLRCAVR